jgi:glutathione S-transferase
VIRLHGFKGSNYYNIVKLALLEKGIPFEEVLVPLGPLGRLAAGEDYLAKSAIGKVPALETDRGYLSETDVILDYLEDLGVGPSFYPSDAFEKAKVREIIKYLELYLELPARRMYGELLHGLPAPEGDRAEARRLLQAGFDALQRLARFDPYIAGKEITYADFYAQFSLSAATWVTKHAFAWDTFNTLPGVRNLIETVGRRPTTRRVMAEQREAR